MDIEAVIAALGGRYDPAEAEAIKRVLREYGGKIPDEQLISEAVRRCRSSGGAGADLARPNSLVNVLFATGSGRQNS